MRESLSARAITVVQGGGATSNRGAGLFLPHHDPLLTGLCTLLPYQSAQSRVASRYDAICRRSVPFLPPSPMLNGQRGIRRERGMDAKSVMCSPPPPLHINQLPQVRNPQIQSSNGTWAMSVPVHHYV